MTNIRSIVFLTVSIINWVVIPAFANDNEEADACVSCHLPVVVQSAYEVDKKGYRADMQNPVVYSNEESKPGKGALMHMFFNILRISSVKR